MLTTTNYGLKKIELKDSPPDITVINPNWDAIDAEFKTVESQLAEVTNFIQGMTIGAIYPTLLNGWVNFNEGYSVVKYWKDTNNVVHIQGVIKGGTVNSVIFVLPAAYKPIGTIAVPVACTNTSGQWVVGVATISSLNGNVQMATNFTATHSINIAFKLK